MEYNATGPDPPNGAKAADNATCDAADSSEMDVMVGLAVMVVLNPVVNHVAWMKKQAAWV